MEPELPGARVTSTHEGPEGKPLLLPGIVIRFFLLLAWTTAEFVVTLSRITAVCLEPPWHRPLKPNGEPERTADF